MADRTIRVGQGSERRVSLWVGQNCSARAMCATICEIARERKKWRLFFYKGGSLPIELELAKRAIELGRRALIVTHGRRGYVGLDLVLGEATDGSQDYVIEVNPRITTSYLGLRQASKTNLAQAMLDVADGNVPGLLFSDECVSFSSTESH